MSKKKIKQAQTFTAPAPETPKAAKPPTMASLLTLLQQLPALMNQLIQVQNQNSRELHELKTFVKVLVEK